MLWSHLTQDMLHNIVWHLYKSTWVQQGLMWSNPSCVQKSTFSSKWKKKKNITTLIESTLHHLKHSRCKIYWMETNYQVRHNHTCPTSFTLEHALTFTLFWTNPFHSPSKPPNTFPLNRGRCPIKEPRFSSQKASVAKLSFFPKNRVSISKIQVIST